MQNILSDPWLPFRLRDGSVQIMPISAIVRPEVVDVSLSREDFHNAVYIFLVALLQTVMTVMDEDEWGDLFHEPPSESELEQAFKPLLHAFQVAGDGPCFMQDFDTLEQAKSVPVAGLLIDAPGENTIKNNTDHFIKRGVGEIMSPAMAVLALWTLQINAPAGGAGHRVGLRGGGPLSVLVSPTDPNASLWQKLWFNVIHRELWFYDEPDLKSSTVFPWLGPTKISKGPNTEIYAHEVHPLHMYWAMPRRIRLEITDKPGICAISGVWSTQTVSSYRTVNYGNNYAGNWEHPLTPYRWDPKKPSELEWSLKAQPGGLNYKIWDILTFASPQHGQRCSLNVLQYDQIRSQLEERGRISPQIWVSGYDMDNMKARGWHSATMPLFDYPLQQQSDLLASVKDLQELANAILWQCRSKVKEAWFESPSEIKGDMSFVDVSFWQVTQKDFFQVLGHLSQSSQQQLNTDQARQWLSSLFQAALHIFDQYAFTSLGDIHAMSKRLIARRQLVGWLHGGKEIKAFKQAYSIQSSAEQEGIKHE